MPEIYLRIDDILFTTSSKYGKHKLNMKKLVGGLEPIGNSEIF